MALRNDTSPALSVYRVLSGWKERTAFLFLICILQDTDFSLDPSGFLPLPRPLQLHHSLWGSGRWKAVTQTSRGCDCMLVNMRARGISGGIRNHNIAADVSVPGGSGSSC